jgi:O-antigen ligase
LVTYYALHHGTYSLLDRQQMAVFVWVGVGIAAICGVLPAVKPPRILLVPLFAILALAAWTLLSMAWTESAERTFAEFARIVGYLGVVVLVWIGLGRNTWRLAAGGLLAAGVLVCFLTLMSRLWPAQFPSDTVAINLKTTRINYPFGYWNAVGCWSAMTITLCLAYAGHARSGVVRGLALASVPMCSVGLYLALSRAGFGGAVIGAIVVVVLAEWRWLTFVQTLLAAAGSAAVILVLRAQSALTSASGTDGAWTLAVALIAVGAVLALIAAWGKSRELGPRLRMGRRSGRGLSIAIAVAAAIAVVAVVATFGGEAYEEFTGNDPGAIATSSDARLAQLNGNRHNLWTSAWRAFEAHPLGGIGAGTFEFWWSRDGANGEFVRDVHNIYLEALAEQGIIGFLLLLAVLLGLLYSAWTARSRLIRARSGAVGVHGGMIAVFAGFLLQAGVDWMWESTAVAVFALVAVALAGAASSEPREGPAGASKSIGLLVVSVLATITMFAGLANQRQIEKSQSAFRAGDLNASVAHADDAIAAQSWSATAYSQRALALEQAGEQEAALKSILIAEDKEPFNWRWPLVASRIYVQLGRPKDAAAALRRARELRPYLKLFGRPTTD